ADGTRIAYRTTTSANSSGLAVRALNELEPRVLNGITGARGPVMSPDGRWIAYFALGELKKMSITGGPAVTLCAYQGGPRGASWSDDGEVVFATSALETGLLSVPAGGGEPKVLTKADTARGEIDHVAPSVLPGGQAVLFTIATGTLSAENSQIGVLDRRTNTQ